MDKTPTGDRLMFTCGSVSKKIFFYFDKWYI
ncbi:unknown [Porphyromonas sp. CAG:1061]|nr:unknown [Porphyromonas sp. CAG:1061]